MRRVAFIDSGVGLIGYAAALHELRPDLAIVLSMDPDHMPYGPRTPEQVRRLILEAARATVPYRPDALVIACNTASVHGLESLRAEFEPSLPVIGTVPAIRPAALAGGPVAVWATAATAASDYLRGLVDAFAADVAVHTVPALGLAEAVDAADLERVDACIAAAADQTPSGIRALVLGCTHYGLVAERIAAAVGPEVTIFDSPEAVARQTLRRVGLEPTSGRGAAPVPRTASPLEAVLLSGRPGTLPPSLSLYPAAAWLFSSDQARSTPAR